MWYRDNIDSRGKQIKDENVNMFRLNYYLVCGT